jgi:DNA-binding protein HU-beta
MNKCELIDAITNKAEASKKAADAALTAALEEIVAAVSTGDKVTLVGFGLFERREVKPVRVAILKLAKRCKLPQLAFPLLLLASCSNNG